MLDYLVGSLITAALLFLWSKKLNDVVDNTQKVKIAYRQSSIHEVLKPFLIAQQFRQSPKKTQARNIRDKNHVRVIFIDGMAYWIANNIVYTADTNENGVIKESTRVVDMMGISSVELDKMLFIMDKLTDGDRNDSGGTGNQ